MSYQLRKEVAEGELRKYWGTGKGGLDLTSFGFPADPFQTVPKEMLWYCIDEQWGVRGIVMNIISLCSQIIDLTLDEKMPQYLGAWSNQGKEIEGKSTIRFRYSNGAEVELTMRRDTEDRNGKILSVLNSVPDWDGYNKYDPSWIPPTEKDQIRKYSKTDYTKVEVELVRTAGTGEFSAYYVTDFPKTPINKEIKYLLFGRDAIKDLHLPIDRLEKELSPKIKIYVRTDWVITDHIYWRNAGIDYRMTNVIQKDEYDDLINI